jgi:dTDP-4-amino-4,6-dideoxygalactose transaminase
MLLKNPENQFNCVRPVIFTPSARIAFRSILENLEFNDNKKLLLPSYIGITDREGSGVYDPVVDSKIQHEFYELNTSLGAVTNDLYSKIESGDFRALLVIHYFGFCQNDIEKMASLCRENGVILIEDCAHCMNSKVEKGTLGEFGDFSIFSHHKILPVEDGGCLQVNNEKFKFTFSSLSLGSPKKVTYKKILTADLKNIREKRRTNYMVLLKLIKGIQGVKIMYEDLLENIAPHNFPVIIEAGRREETYFKLIERNIPVTALYYRMIDPIKEGAFDNSIFVSDNILNMPIHQDIEKDDIQYMAQSLSALL